MSTSISTRLAALREAMQAHDVAACLIPSDDPHMSEYLPGHWQARVHFSGFTGSAGTLLVAREFAGLWTDSRYFERSEEHTSELQSRGHLVCRLLLEKKNIIGV